MDIFCSAVLKAKMDPRAKNNMHSQGRSDRWAACHIITLCNRGTYICEVFQVALSLMFIKGYMLEKMQIILITTHSIKYMWYAKNTCLFRNVTKSDDALLKHLEALCDQRVSLGGRASVRSTLNDKVETVYK